MPLANYYHYYYLITTTVPWGLKYLYIPKCIQRQNELLHILRYFHWSIGSQSRDEPAQELSDLLETRTRFELSAYSSRGLPIGV